MKRTSLRDGADVVVAFVLAVGDTLRFRLETMTRSSARALGGLAVAIVALIVGLAVILPSAAHASHAPESIFQDDDHLIYASDATVAHTLDVLKGLGVDRIRVTILWKAIAPDPSATAKPAGFNATDPAAYPSGAWGPYDRVLEMAQARGIGVDFNVTAPGPLWAMQPAPTTPGAGTQPADHYEPSATDFGQFVQALGTRYSGTYVPSTTTTTTTTTPGPLPILLPPTTTTTTTTTTTGTALPRVDFWSIWNEPDQPGWLAPQWRSYRGRRVPDAPRLYRALTDAAIGALYATGHMFSTDTILIGETAPEGDLNTTRVGGQERYTSATGTFDAITPMVFVRALFCVGSKYHRLTGTAAAAQGCPQGGSAHAFVIRNSGLFYATGYAHHPYFFNFAPSYSSPIANFVPLSDLGRLERGLDRIYSTYGVHRRIPIYLTEYGYQTRPPDPLQVVTPAEQAEYINEADYLAWRDPRVRAMSQFLLYDAGPNPLYPPSSFDYWDTFQTGLVYGPGTFRDGRRKPAFAAYRLPIWIPHQTVKRGASMFVWSMLRMAPRRTAQRAFIQFKSASGGSYHTITTVNVPAKSVYGYFTTNVDPPRTGSIRLAWRSAAGQTFRSRVVSVTVR